MDDLSIAKSNTLYARQTANAVSYEPEGMPPFPDIACSPRMRRELQKTRIRTYNLRPAALRNFDRRLVAIHEECLANRWRPQVSHHGTTKWALSWWTLGKPSEDRFLLARWKRKWTGLTYSNASRFEEAAIAACIATVRKRDRYVEPEDWPDDHPYLFSVGSGSVWFRHLADHDKFVSMLEALPQRRHAFEIKNVAGLRDQRHLLRGRNFQIHRPRNEEPNILSVEDFRGVALLKLFAG